jgi:hypothetical protein
MVFKFFELDQSKIVTKADPEVCRLRGAEHDDDAMTNGLTTLLPLVREHTGRFTGYDAKLRTELEYLAGEHGKAVAERKDQAAGGKKGSRKIEAQTLRKGKNLLRESIEGLDSAIVTRAPLPEETPEKYTESNTSFLERLTAIKGDIGHNSGPLRTKLENAATLLAEPKLSLRLAELVAEGRDLPKEVAAIIPLLPAKGEEKKAQQQAAKAATADLDKLQGLIYFNLKRFTKAGRSHYLRQGDPTTAALFNLSSINKGAPSGGGARGRGNIGGGGGE